MIEQYLWGAGSLIFALMGAAHLYGTLFTPFMHPRNKTLVGEMDSAPLVMTEKLTLWKSWIGFNATHSVGVVFIGGSNLYIVCRYFEVFRRDPIFPFLTILALFTFIWVARKYWFRSLSYIFCGIVLLLLTSYGLMIFRILRA